MNKCPYCDFCIYRQMQQNTWVCCYFLKGLSQVSLDADVDYLLQKGLAFGCGKRWQIMNENSDFSVIEVPRL